MHIRNLKHASICKQIGFNNIFILQAFAACLENNFGQIVCSSKIFNEVKYSTVVNDSNIQNILRERKIYVRASLMTREPENSTKTDQLKLNSTKTLKPGFAKYAVDTNLF